MTTVSRLLAINSGQWDGTSIAISADGRYAVYAQQPLPGGDVQQVYVEDLQTGAKTLVSDSKAGVAGNGGSSDVAITGDDNTVFFESTSSNLIPGYVATVGTPDDPDDTGEFPYEGQITTTAFTTLYSKNLTTGSVQVIAAPNPNAASGEAAAIISGLSVPPGGTVAAYVTDYLDASDDVLNRALVYQNLANGKVTGALLPAGTVALLAPSISSDGKWLVYQTYTLNSAINDVAGGNDVWLENTATQQTIRISQTADSTAASQLAQASDPGLGAVISADGSTVAFYSSAPLLGPGQFGVFEYDVPTGKLSLAIPGLIGDGGDVINLSISSDGRYLAAPDGVYDRDTGTIESVPGGSGHFDSIRINKVSDDGHYLLQLDSADTGSIGSRISLVDLRPPSAVIDDLGHSGLINAALDASDLTHGIAVTGSTTNVEAGNVLTFTLMGVTQTAVVQADGSWSVTVSPADVAALTDGQYEATASVLDNGGTVATATMPVQVDTMPPSEVVTGVDIGSGDVITPAIQLASRTTLVTGTLSAALAAGDQIEVVVAGHTYAGVVDPADPLVFSAQIATPARFGAVQAFVVNQVGNQSATKAQTYQLDAVSTLASTGPNGQANLYDNGDAVISADGNHVVFESSATNLVAGASGKSLYEKNLLTGDITMIATGQSGPEGQSILYAPSVDGDGGEVAYVIGTQVEVYTAGQGSVAIGSNDDEALNYYNGTMVLSADGNFLTYNGPASQEKVVVDTKGDYDYVYVPVDSYSANPELGKTLTEVILAEKSGGVWTRTTAMGGFPIGTFAPNGTGGGSLSAGGPPFGTYEDGYVIVRPDGYVQTAFDLINAVVSNVSYTYTPGGVVQLPNDGVYNTHIDGISSDGNIILFDTASPTFPGANGRDQAYEYNLTTDALTLVSAGANGPANANIANASMSADGRYVVFDSNTATNLSTEAAASFYSDVYVKDVQTGAVQWIGLGTVSAEAISADGRFVTYTYGGQVEVADLQAPKIVLAQIDINAELDVHVIPPATNATLETVPDHSLSAEEINAVRGDPSGETEISGAATVPDGTQVIVTFNGQTSFGTEHLISGDPSDVEDEWTVDIQNADIAAIKDGTYVLTASTTDAAARTATASWTFVVDTTPPSTPILTGLTPATDSGSSQTDGLTSNPNPLVMGTGEAGSDVQLYENGQKLGETLVDQNGNFAVQIATALSPGVHNITAKATDEVYNDSATSSPLTITIETQAPSGGTSAGDPDAAASATSVTYTINLAASESLGINDFALTATGSAAGAITAVTGSGTQYAVKVSDITGLGSLAVGLAEASEIADAAGNLQKLTSTAHTVDIPPPSPTMYGSGQSNVTNQSSVEIAGFAPAAGDTVTVFDGTTAVGSYTVGTNNLYYYVEEDNLAEGNHVFTAVATDPSTGAISAPTAAYDLTVDYTPPSETVQSLTIDGGNAISLSDQRNLPTVTITGVLSAPLAAGNTVFVTLNGDTETATPSQDGLSFSVAMNTPGVDGTVSAFVQDQAGNSTAIATQSFTAAAALDLKLITATPDNQAQTHGSNPTISGDGSVVAFTAQNGFYGFVASIGGPPAPAAFQSGIYVDQLATGTVSLAAAGGDTPSLSNNGTILAYTGHDPVTYANVIYVKDLATPGSAPILVSADADGTADPYYNSDPSLSGDGTELTFSSISPTLGGRNDPQSEQKIFLADIANGAVTDVRLIAGDDTGYSSNARISEDGSVVTFISSDTDLVTGATSGAYEVYAEALRGPNAGTITLVSSLPDGTAAPNGALDASISADGRYVLFDSTDTSLTPDNLQPGQTLSGRSEVFVKDLQTGELSLVSTTASGIIAAGDSYASQISGNGEFVAFTSDASNLGAPSQGSEQAFVKNLITGQVTLVSEPGGVPGDQSSQNVALSDAGDRVVFSSNSDNLVANDQNHSSDVFEVDTVTVADTAPPTVTVPQSITAAATSAAGAVVNFTATAADPVDGTDPVTFSQASGSEFAIGTTIVTADATDKAGNRGTASFTVTVADTAPPTVTVPQSITVAATSAAGAVVNFTATAADLVDRTDPVTFSQASGSEFAIGTTIVTADATDKAGNKGTASFTVTVYQPTGVAEDGYIVGGTVGYDDGTGHISHGEPTTITDSHGEFRLSGGSGPYVLTGGTDSATGLAFTGAFEAPAGSSVLSPLTTLVEAEVKASGDSTPAGVIAVNVAVDAALGLPAGTDLTALDAVSGAFEGNATATAAFEASSDILNAVTLIAAAGGSPDAAYEALAAAVQAGGTLDLTDPATIESVAQSAGLDTTAATSVASVVSTTHAALEQQLGSATTPLQALDYITGASIAEQGDAASLFHVANSDAEDSAVANSYIESFGAILSNDDITAADNAPCYCPGTLIATDKGEVAVEHLKIGDRVLTMAGQAKPIKWIGRRSYSGRFVLGRQDIFPVCLKAGCLDDNLPKRDLWISPHHAMYLEGILIEAKDLINGVSIVQAESVETVEYFHIELESHDVIIAEGSLSESFIDDDSRGMFHNAYEYAALFPNASRVPARYCAPRLDCGYEIEAIRKALALRAGIRGALNAGVGPLRGNVDTVSSRLVEGWVQNSDAPEAPVCLDVFAGGKLIGQTLANRYRRDLEQAGLGSGYHSFSFTPPEEVLLGEIAVRRSIDGVTLSQADQNVIAA